MLTSFILQIKFIHKSQETISVFIPIFMTGCDIFQYFVTGVKGLLKYSLQSVFNLAFYCFLSVCYNFYLQNQLYTIITTNTQILFDPVPVTRWR